MIFILVIVFIGVIILEVPSLVKNKQWHEIKIFSIFLVVAFLMSMAYILDMSIPNPVKWIEYLIKDMLHLNY